MKFKKWLRDVGVAFENMWHELTTPRHVTEDERTAQELLARGRILGVYPRQVFRWISQLAAVGADDDQVDVLMRIVARGRIDTEDLAALGWAGIQVHVPGSGVDRYGE